MSTQNFKGNITGDGHQFGDNYYLDSKSFIDKTKRPLSKTEEELVSLIFANFQSEIEKKELLDNLSNLDDNPIENTKSKSIWEKFAAQLMAQGLKEAASKVISYVGDRFKNWDQFTGP